jgi:hypothetical protein
MLSTPLKGGQGDGIRSCVRVISAKKLITFIVLEIYVYFFSMYAYLHWKLKALAKKMCVVLISGICNTSKQTKARLMKNKIFHQFFLS